MFLEYPIPPHTFNKAVGSQEQKDLFRQSKKQERFNKSKQLSLSSMSDILHGENVVNSLLRKLKIVLFKNSKPNAVQTSNPSTQEADTKGS